MIRLVVSSRLYSEVVQDDKKLDSEGGVGNDHIGNSDASDSCEPSDSSRSLHPARGLGRPQAAQRPRTPIAMPFDAAAKIPETLRYRLKNKLLGPPLVTEQLTSERLGRPSALGVLAPDCISSSAYGTEEMLTQLVPYVGLAAFSLVVPITLAIIGVLFFVTLSYLEVIQLYTKAGGSYVVARDNFGPKIAQIAAVALLIDYTVTVAVQTSAGTAVLTSAIPSLTHLTVPITVGVVLLLLYGNLRGIREAGKVFAFPTYFFIISLSFVIVVGFIRAALGQLHPEVLPPVHLLVGHSFGKGGNGWLLGLGFIYLLRSFANGGSSLTGLEAISNGVSSFRPPEARHARQTLVVMSSVLAFLVLGVTMLARWTHAVPYAAGTPTVVAQEVKDVLGTGPIGSIIGYVVLLAIMLVLYTGGNTSFNGFPYLASFVAGDRFLPRQMTRRGHRLVFSNGIIVLTVVAVTLILVFKANVDSLVALYAIGVFTGFFMAGSGMVKHHLTYKAEHWRRSVAVNGFAAVLTATVVLIFLIAKFAQGAWVIAVVGPLLYFSLIRTHRQYEEETQELEVGAVQACEAPILRRHVVVVLVERLDMATARAIQYARTLTPDDLRAVHFDIDSKEARELENEWGRLGLSSLPLDIIECPDRRLGRAAVELAADAVLDGDTECTVLLPRRGFASGWQRFLHDRTADKIAALLGQVAHVSATIVPYNLQTRLAKRGRVGDSAMISQAISDAGDQSDGGSNAKMVIDPEGRSGIGVEISDGELSGSGGHSAMTRAQDSSARSTRADRREATRESAVSDAGSGVDRVLARRSASVTPIAEAQWRQRVTVVGRIKSVRVQPKAGTSNLECVLSDGTGGLLLVFQGRPRIPGIEPGAKLVAEGMIGSWGRRSAILNPDYELLGDVTT